VTATISRRTADDVRKNRERARWTERDGKTRARERRNGAPGTRCHPIIAFALPFHAAKWQKRVPRFFLRAFDNPRRYLVSSGAAPRRHVRRRFARVLFVNRVTITPIVPSRICISRIKWPRTERDLPQPPCA